MPSQRTAGLWWKRALHGTVLVVSLGAVAWEAGKALEKWRSADATDPALLTFDLRWLAGSAASYVIGLALLGIPWWAALGDLESRMPLGAVVRVYLVSHVGKYVPGKAMVLVIRCGLLGPLGASVAGVILTSFYETFATMASGSLSAAVCLTVLPVPAGFDQFMSENPWLLWIVLAMLAGFGAAVWPAGFEWFTRTVTLPFKAARRFSSRRVAYSTLAIALVVGAGSWLVVGFSYLAVLNSVSVNGLGSESLPLATAAVAMSIVLGFVSMLPGQIGVRELVLIEAFKPVVGEPVAVAGSLLFRLVTLLAELAVALVLYLGGQR